MNDDDDTLFTALTVMVVLFAVGGVGLIIWSFL
jgi:flagellar basal body-associated protein FliL